MHEEKPLVTALLRGQHADNSLAGVFFSETVDTVTTYYNIADNGNLVINSATSGPDNNPTRCVDEVPRPAISLHNPRTHALTPVSKI